MHLEESIEKLNAKYKTNKYLDNNIASLVNVKNVENKTLNCDENDQNIIRNLIQMTNSFVLSICRYIIQKNYYLSFYDNVGERSIARRDVPANSLNTYLSSSCAI